MSSLEKVRPGIRIEAKEPEKKIPSTAAKAIKCRPLVRDPMKGPVGLMLNARNCFDGVEEVITLGGVLDVGIDEERVSFRVDVLHHDLETIEAPCLGDLNLIGEAFVEVLVDDTVGSCEEGENMWNEVTFIVVETIVPVVDIFG
jgi:hypothetical protein